jgi:hypothetical protein
MKRLPLVLLLMVLGTGAAFFARRKPIATPPPEAERRAEANAIAAHLLRLDGYPFEVRYSPSAREQAVRLANLTRDGYMYFATAFPGTSPTLTATFLAPADWPRGYGVPSYYPPDRRLRVATDDNVFWQSFGKMARLTSPFDAYPMLKKTYADSSGALQIRRFFDLIAVHELAHAFAIQGEADFPTLWLQEIFANLALYAFVARTRPAELPYLTTFPEAETHIPLFNIMTRVRGYTSLDDFDRHFPMGKTDKPLGDANYGWYQVRFVTLAAEVFEEGGEPALIRLWAFGQAEKGKRQSPAEYFAAHGTIAGWSDGIHSKDVATRLANEVSPRLGQAIKAWH